MRTTNTSNRYLIALVAALGLIPVVLDTTIVTVALNPIRAELHTDVNTAQWIITGFFLANAAVVATGGYLATRFGRKRLFALGIAVFTAGSLLCALAPGIRWLIAFRALQGIGGGILLPLGPALAFDAFPREERARASALVGIPILLAPVFGPILGGYLTDTFDWHSIFLVNLPVGMLAIALALLVLPRDEVRAGRGARFDYAGLVLSTLGFLAIIYAFTLVTETNPSTVTAAHPGGALYGWGYWPVWALSGGGIVALGLFALYALRISRDPALDLRLFARREFLVSNLLNWAGAVITFGLLVLLPLYFELVRLPHLSALETGVALVPFGVGTLAGMIVATALYRAIGPRLVVLLGSALSTVSAWRFAEAIHATADAGQLWAGAQSQAPLPAVAGPDELRGWMFLLGMGFVMVGIAVQTLALEALKGEALAKASSLVLATKLLFSSIGVAILTTILVDRTESRAATLATQLQAFAQSSGAAPGTLADPALQARIASQAGTWAIQGIFWLIFFGSFGLLALALALPGRGRHRAAAQAEQAEGERVAITS